jgi:hypothetical protein
LDKAILGQTTEDVHEMKKWNIYERKLLKVKMKPPAKAWPENEHIHFNIAA